MCTGLMADKLLITALAGHRFEEFRKEVILFLPAQTHTHISHLNLEIESYETLPSRTILP